MYYPKTSFAGLPAICSDDTRPSLNHLLLESDGSTVTTNGHVLVHISAPDTDYSADYPKVSAEQIPANRHLVPRETVKTIIAACGRAKKANKHLPILNGCVLTEKGLCVSDLQGEVMANGIHPESVDTDPGLYPNWKQVTYAPLGDMAIAPVVTVGINIHVLKQIVATFEAAYPEYDDDQNTLSFEIQDNLRAIRVTKTAPNRNGQTVTVVAMPARLID